MTDLQYEYTRSVADRAQQGRATRRFARVNAAFAELAAEAGAQLASDGDPPEPHGTSADRGMPLRRPGLRAARRRCRTGRSTATIVGDGDPQLLRRSQAGLWPRLRRSVVRDRSRCALIASVRDRHAAAAGLRARRPRATRRTRGLYCRATPCSTTEAARRRRATRASKLLADDTRRRPGPHRPAQFAPRSCRPATSPACSSHGDIAASPRLKGSA